MAQVIINLEAGYDLEAITAVMPAEATVLGSGPQLVTVDDDGCSNALLISDVKAALDGASIAYNSVVGI